MGGRKGRDGLFPASDCIKVTGYYADTEESMMVRGCALDSGTLTTDTEIIRMSHCGSFYFNEKYVHGCVQSCDDADGCDGAGGLLGDAAVARTLLALLSLLFAHRSCLSPSNFLPLLAAQTQTL